MAIKKKPNQGWLDFLSDRYEELVSCKRIPFILLKPRMMPEVPGVYLITARNSRYEYIYYIGRTKNLRQRVYQNHLMGGLSTARLKKYLIKDIELTGVKDKYDAKEYIKANCYVRWIEENDMRNRAAIEGYTTGLLFPKYGMYEEH